VRAHPERILPRAARRRAGRVTRAPGTVALERTARELGALLAARGWRIATAESCTGGWLAQTITAIAGSSEWFEGGLVTYSNAAKVGLAGVDPLIIERAGAVSPEAAAALADGARRALVADVGVAVTGVAGPGGGSVAKPVGMVCFGFAIAGRETATLWRHFAGDRRAVRAQAVACALAELSRMLA
jgi:nicotinamide-nucleotide amidase